MVQRKHLWRLLLLLALVGVAFTVHAAPWSPGTFPNPQKDLYQCGRWAAGGSTTQKCNCSCVACCSASTATGVALSWGDTSGGHPEQLQDRSQRCMRHPRLSLRKSHAYVSAAHGPIQYPHVPHVLTMVQDQSALSSLKKGAEATALAGSSDAWHGGIMCSTATQHGLLPCMTDCSVHTPHPRPPPPTQAWRALHDMRPRWHHVL
jgi:hypothetical protein